MSHQRFDRFFLKFCSLILLLSFSSSQLLSAKEPRELLYQAKLNFEEDDLQHGIGSGGQTPEQFTLNYDANQSFIDQKNMVGQLTTPYPYSSPSPKYQNQNDVPTQNGTQKKESDYVRGELIVRFKDEAMGFLDKLQEWLTHEVKGEVEKSQDYLKRGVESLRALAGTIGNSLLRLGLAAIERIFPLGKVSAKVTETQKALSRTYLLHFDESSIGMKEAIKQLESDSWVDYAETNKVFILNDISPIQMANRPNLESFLEDDFSEFWGLKRINTKEAWKQFDVNGNGVWDSGEKRPGEGVVVAVLDTGVYYNHPDLFDNVWVNAQEIAYSIGERNADGVLDWKDADFNNDGRVNLRDIDGLGLDANRNVTWSADRQDGKVEEAELRVVSSGVDEDGNGFVDDILGWDFTSNKNTVLDQHVHGTHVAGTIAASGRDGGISGVAPFADLLSVRVLNKFGYGDTVQIAKGIYYATDQGADVINMSLGGPGPRAGNDFKLLNAAVDYAYENDAFVVVAAGNSGIDAYEDAPANADHAITVSAIQPYKDYWAPGDLTYFSNYGSVVEIAAPGQDILSTTPYGYDSFSGTSMASPHVSGALALLRSKDPLVSFESALQALEQSAKPFESKYFAGHGILDVNALLHANPSSTAKADIQLPNPSADTVGIALQAGQVLQIPIHVEGKQYRLDYALGRASDRTVDPKNPEFNLTNDWVVLSQKNVRENDFTIPVDFRGLSYPIGTYSVLRLTVWDEEGRSFENRVYFYLTDTTPPTGNIVVNAGSPTTSSRKVEVQLNVSDRDSKVELMSFYDADQWSAWESFQPTKKIVLPANNQVKVKVRDTFGNEQIFQTQIEYRLTQNIEIDKLWNLISFQVDTNKSLAQLRALNNFESSVRFAVVDSAQKDSRAWIEDESQFQVKAGSVLWVFNEAGQKINMTLSGRPNISKINLSKGIQFISAFEKTVDRKDLYLNGKLFTGSIKRWNQATQTFVETTVLEKDKGYLIEVPSSGVLSYSVEKFSLPLDRGYSIETLSDGRIIYHDALPNFVSAVIHLNALNEFESFEYRTIRFFGAATNTDRFHIYYSKNESTNQYQLDVYEGCRENGSECTMLGTVFDNDKQKGQLRQYQDYVTKQFFDWNSPEGLKQLQRTTLVYDRNQGIRFQFDSSKQMFPIVEERPFIQMTYLGSEFPRQLRIGKIFHYDELGKKYTVLSRGAVDVNEELLGGIHRTHLGFKQALSDDLLINLSLPILSSTPNALFSFTPETDLSSTINFLTGIQVSFDGKEVAKNLRTRVDKDGKIVLSVPGPGTQEQQYEVSVKENGQLFLQLIKSQISEKQTMIELDSDMAVRRFSNGEYSIQYAGASYLSQNGIVSIDNPSVKTPIQIKVNFTQTGTIQSLHQFATKDSSFDVIVTFEPSGSSDKLRIKKIVSTPIQADSLSNQGATIWEMDYDKMQIVSEKPIMDQGKKKTYKVLDIYQDIQSMNTFGLKFGADTGFLLRRESLTSGGPFITGSYIDGKLASLGLSKVKNSQLPHTDSDKYIFYSYTRFGDWDVDPEKVDWGSSELRTIEKFKERLKDDLVLRNTEWFEPDFYVHFQSNSSADLEINPYLINISDDNVTIGMNSVDGDSAQNSLYYDEAGHLKFRAKFIGSGLRIDFNVTSVDSDWPGFVLEEISRAKVESRLWTDLRIPGNPLVLHKMDDGTYDVQNNGFDDYYPSDSKGLIRFPNGLRMQIVKNDSREIEFIDIWKDPAYAKGLEGEGWVYRYYFYKGPSEIITNRGDIFNLTKIDTRPVDCPTCSLQPYLEKTSFPPTIKIYSLSNPGAWTQTIYNRKYSATIEIDSITGRPGLSGESTLSRPLFIAEGIGQEMKVGRLYVESGLSNDNLKAGVYEIIPKGKSDINFDDLKKYGDAEDFRITPDFIKNFLKDDLIVRTGNADGNFEAQVISFGEGANLQLQEVNQEGLVFKASFPNGQRVNNLKTSWDAERNLTLQVPFLDGTHQDYRVTVDDVGVLSIQKLQGIEKEYRIKFDSGVTLQKMTDGKFRLIYGGVAYLPNEQGVYVVDAQNKNWEFLLDEKNSSIQMKSTVRVFGLNYTYRITFAPSKLVSGVQVPQEFLKFSGNNPNPDSSWVYNLENGTAEETLQNGNKRLWIAKARDALGFNRPVGYQLYSKYEIAPSISTFLILDLNSNGEIIGFQRPGQSDQYFVLKKAGVDLKSDLDWSQIEARTSQTFKQVFKNHFLVDSYKSIKIISRAANPLYESIGFYLPRLQTIGQIKLSVSVREPGTYFDKYFEGYSLQSLESGKIRLAIPELGEEYEAFISENGELSIRIQKETRVESAIYHVYPSDNLQEIINQAKEGDEIRLHAGEYHGNFTLKEGVNLVGENQQTTILNGDFKPGENGIVAKGKNQIENLTITGGAAYNNAPASAIKINGAGVGVRNCRIIGNKDYGVWVNTSQSVIIEGNTFEGNQVAIQLPKDQTVIRANQFLNNHIGINILSGKSPLIEDNEFRGHTFGSIYEYAERKNPTRGYAKVKNNIFSHNVEKGSYYGPALPLAVENQIDGNRILDVIAPTG